jgi:CHAT domain-containing protein
LDEGLHLTGACQLAGFQSVVGSLGQVRDDHSPNVAMDVYRKISANGDTLDVSRTAEGLHFAIRALKEATEREPGLCEKVPDDPFIWAPHIHVGA